MRVRLARNWGNWSKARLCRDTNLQVKKFQAAENLRACHILFISESEKKSLPAILAALNGASVLTVADMDNFTDREE